MRPSTSCRAAKRAFTLIELVVVLVLMSILSMLIIPEMRGTMDDAVLRAAGREWIHAFDLAGSQAVSRSQVVRVHYYSGEHRYEFEREVESKEGRDAFERVADLQGANGKLDSTVKVSIHPTTGDDSMGNPPGADRSGGSIGGSRGNLRRRNSQDTIAFYPDGTADSCRILLEDRSGYKLALLLNPITSRVEIRDVGRR